MSSGRVFISYRRGEDGAAAGRLHDRLVRLLGKEALFFDVDGIPFGQDFHVYLEQQVEHCDVFVVVIGRGWLADVARLQNEDDFVRIEVAAALRREAICLIPVLLDGVQMPPEAQLPEPLRPLPRRAAVAVPHEHFASVVDGRLADAIKAARAGAGWIDGRRILLVTLVIIGVTVAFSLIAVPFLRWLLYLLDPPLPALS